MKFRSGFVSNSSSSSFLIYGVALDNEAAVELAKRLAGPDDAIDDIEDMEMHELYSLIDEHVPKGLVIEWPMDDYDIFIGASWDTVRDNETGKEFKERVLASLRGMGMLDLKAKDLGTHEAAWSDG